MGIAKWAMFRFCSGIQIHKVVEENEYQIKILYVKYSVRHGTYVTRTRWYDKDLERHMTLIRE